MHTLPTNHPTLPTPKTGLLLLNLGTPDGTDYWSVRRYLAEFLSDKRVIDAPRWFWLPLLHGLILTTRPFRSGHAYKSIWNESLNESPLKTHMRTLTEQVTVAFNSLGGQTGRPRSEGGDNIPKGCWTNSDEPQNPLVIEWAMRYGTPSIESAIDRLQSAGCRRIIALALYPQYSATTTASAYDAVFSALQKTKWQPALTTLGPYHDHPLYIEALADSIRANIAESLCAPKEHPRSEGGDTIPKGGWTNGNAIRPEGELRQNEANQPSARGGEPSPSVRDSELHVICSFHGLPKRYFEQGDPYHCHCQKTSRLLREAMQWPESHWHTAFQSRFGPAKWLEPYLTDTVSRLASEGAKHIAIISPGFAVDCIETLEELNIALRAQFLSEGGESFTYIPCLNASPSQARLIQSLAQSAL